MFDRCAICGIDKNLEYCGMCKHYFCARCKRRYPARVAAMMREKVPQVVDAVQDVVGSFLNFFGVK